MTHIAGGHTRTSRVDEGRDGALYHRVRVRVALGKVCCVGTPREAKTEGEREERCRRISGRRRGGGGGLLLLRRRRVRVLILVVADICPTPGEYGISRVCVLVLVAADICPTPAEYGITRVCVMGLVVADAYP